MTTSSRQARRPAKLESAQYATDPLIIVWDITAADLAILTGNDAAARAALCEAAGLHGPGFDAALIVEWLINVHAAPHSFAAVLQRA